LIFAAIAEASTGLGLLLVPTVVGQLLLGQELVGVACWPGSPLLGMVIYSAVVTLYLAFFGVSGLSGILLGRAWLGGTTA
jgi:hypothetical protein